MKKKSYIVIFIFIIIIGFLLYKNSKFTATDGTLPLTYIVPENTTNEITVPVKDANGNLILKDGLKLNIKSGLAGTTTNVSLDTVLNDKIKYSINGIPQTDIILPSSSFNSSSSTKLESMYTPNNNLTSCITENDAIKRGYTDAISAATDACNLAGFPEGLNQLNIKPIGCGTDGGFKYTCQYGFSNDKGNIKNSIFFVLLEVPYLNQIPRTTNLKMELFDLNGNLYYESGNNYKISDLQDGKIKTFAIFMLSDGYTVITIGTNAYTYNNNYQGPGAENIKWTNAIDPSADGNLSNSNISIEQTVTIPSATIVVN